MKQSLLEQSQSYGTWCSVPLHRSPSLVVRPRLTPNTWVRLLTLLNPFCHDEALLLCQHSESEWVAWIPDHGEAILSIEQFCAEDDLIEA